MKAGGEGELFKNIIQIYSIDDQTSIAKMKKIIEESNERIIKDKGNRIETDSYIYRAQKFSQNLRGNKFNYLYADNEMSDEEKDQAIKNLRPSPNLLPEELDHWHWRSFISYY